MTIYEIDQEILSCMDAETGEVIDIDRLAELSMARDQKLEGVALWIKNLDSEAKAILEEEKILAERRRVKEAKAERLKDFLASQLDGQTMETSKVRLSWRASKKAVVDDQDMLLASIERMGLDSCITYQAPKVNLTEVGKLLKGGEEIPGVHMEERNNLQIK